MLDITHFGLFLISIFFLCITPGPDLAYVVGQSVANGKRSGIISAIGVALGSCTHVVASAVGLTAMIMASPIMFQVIKYLGAAYLIYLGSKMLLGTFLGKKSSGAEMIETKISTSGLLSRGFITTLTNPKVLLFFISFFPQFVSADGYNHALSFLMLGLIYALIAFITDVTFAILAGGAAGAVSKSIRLQKILDRVVGTTFIGLGIRLALIRR
ncbi:LysE family translocator [Rouxiella sp. WC2420]|uniref:LysE family translocator n=1 Tax=Rouxiella sp. WC2420 TaxID=3234145 RepID=A0AB39VU52_9GAMM